MKRNVLCINIESNYHSPPRALAGRTGGTYGTAFWSPSHNAQVCRVPDEKWSAAIHRDIIQMSIVPGNKWAVEDEFVCADGATFTSLCVAQQHEAEMQSSTEAEPEKVESTEPQKPEQPAPAPTDELTWESLQAMSKGTGGFFRLRNRAVKSGIPVNGISTTAAMLEAMSKHFNLNPLAEAA